MGNNNRRSYKNKVVWIVGASSGVGRSLAQSLYKEGAFCILSSRNIEKLAELRDELVSGEPGERVKIVPLDISDLKDVEEVVKLASHSFDSQGGRLDLLVLASGVSNRSSVLDSDFGVQEMLMRVNFLGPAELTKNSLPYLIASKGQVCIISSIQGKVGLPLRSAYSASKHAIHGFYDSLRAEVDHLGVSISVVVLGYVNTNLSRNAITTSVEKRHNFLDKTTAAGFSTDYVSSRIIRSLKLNYSEIVISQLQGRIALWLQAYAPSLLKWYINRKGKKEIEQQKKLV